MICKYKAFQCNPSEEISPGLWFCEAKGLWWKDGMIYDELSAQHNGIIGAGAQLKNMIKEVNHAS